MKGESRGGPSVGPVDCLGDDREADAMGVGVSAVTGGSGRMPSVDCARVTSFENGQAGSEIGSGSAAACESRGVTPTPGCVSDGVISAWRSTRPSACG